MKRSIGGDGLLYLLSLALPGMASLLVLPFTTRALGVNEYGVLELCTAAAVLLTSIATLEMPQGLARYLPEADGFEARRAIGSTTLVFCVISLGLAGLAALGIAAALGKGPVLSGNDPALAPVALAWLVSTGAQAVAVRHLRWSLRAKDYLVAVLAGSAVGAAATLLLLHWLGGSASTVLIAQTAGSTTGFLAGALLARGELTLRWDWAVQVRLTRFSLPLVLSALGSLASAQIGRVLVAQHLGVEDTGRLGLAMRITGFLGLAASAFPMAVTPLVYARHKEALTPEWLAGVTRVYVFLGLCGLILLTELAPLLVNLLAGPGFEGAIPLIPPLGAAVLLVGFTSLLPGLELRGDTGMLAGFSIGAAALAVGSMWVLLPVLGVFAAALGPLISALCLALLVAPRSQARFPVPHRWSGLTVAWTLSGVVVLLAASGLFSSTAVPVRLALELAVVGALFLLLRLKRDLTTLRNS